MGSGIATMARQVLTAIGRKTPFVGLLFAEIDALRSKNATLSSERDGSNAARERAEEARWQAVREREQAEAARWQAVRERERADKALWQAQREPEATARILQSGPVPQNAVSTGNGEGRETSGIHSLPTADLAPVATASWPHGIERRSIDPTAMKISILLPNYNHGAFIKENIEAVLAQTYPNWELVIVDDGSTDDSREIICSFAKGDSRISPIFLPENRGAMFAIHTGLAAATGTLLYGSAADDHISNVLFFEIAIASLMQYPEASGVFGKAQVIDASSGKKLWEMGSSPASGFFSPQVALEAFLTGSLFVPGAAAIWKRAHIDAVGGFDPTLGPQIDYFLNHALPAMTGAVFVDDAFVTVRAAETNYHRSAGSDEILRRHALVEKKLRSLNLPAAIDPRWLHVWRERLINSQLAVTRQQAFFTSVRDALATIKPWEQNSLPAGFVDCSSRVLAEVNQLERDLADRVSSAYRMLDAVAGSLASKNEPNGLAQP